MSADAELMARLELSLHLHNLTQAEKTLLARDLLQFATPEEALRVARELLTRVALEPVAGLTDNLKRDVFRAAGLATDAVQYLDESKAREAGGT